MAKKQQPKLSYGPNMGLIAGEAKVAASEAGLSNVGQSFVTGAASVFGAIKQANAERDARMEAYESEIGGLVNTNQFEDPKNKQVIKGFLNTQRDEYIKLSKIYDKTKDREVKDKMEEIKFSLVNLNDQIKVFNQDKLDYRTASDENQLASLKTYDRTGDDFFTTAFTNNAAFSIDEMGDINFGINNNSYKYKDKAGKWQSKNNIDESNLLKIYGDSYKEGGKGNAFNSGNVRRGLYNSFKNTGNSALQVFVTTDLTSDESSLSFEEQFASGKLSKEMYAGFTPTGKDKDGVDTYDTDWMFENKNGDILRNKVSDYFTKVVEDGHKQGRTDNYKPEPALIPREDGKSVVGGYENSGFDYRTETNGDPKKGIQGITQVSYSQKAARRNALLNFETIPGAHYEYRFELDGKTNEKAWKAYSKTDDTFVRNMGGAEVARIEGLQGTEDSSYSVFNVKKAAAVKKEKEDKVSDVSGGAYVGLVNVEGASNADAAAALNNHFPDIKGRYEFRDRGGFYNPQEYYPSGSKKRLTRTTSKPNEVWLYNSETGEAVMRGGKPIIVNTGKSADKSQIQELNNFLADYINKDPFIIEEE